MDPPRSEPLDPFTRKLSSFTLGGMTAINTMLYRLTDGNVGGEIPNGGRLLLLTTTGRRSGRRLTVPLLYVGADPDGSPSGPPNRLAIVASKGGEPTHPAWYHNVIAHPMVDVHVDAEEMPATATVATAEERSWIWPRLVRQYRYFADYTHRASLEGGREIPVVFLHLDRSRATQWRRANM